MANNRPTLYVGITNSIERRSVEHRYKFIDGFTNKYNLSKLVYFEHFLDVKEAIEREKQIKHWNRIWKLKLIQKANPKFEDLYDKLILGGRKTKTDPRSGRG
jgi:putative endonuclease